MNDSTKTLIIDEASMMRALARITHEIIEKNKGTENLVLVGIRSRGVPLAEILRDNLKKIENTDIPLGILDITMYRDDLSYISKEEVPLVNQTELPFDINGKDVILVDDVIYTGRTVRAGIEALFAKGRPSSIQLAVMVDRGHRELPIRPDFIGKNIPTSKSENISVKVFDIDGVNEVSILR